MSEQASFRERLEGELMDQGTRPLLEAYFRRQDPAFAGELFNTFGVNDPYGMRADDLLAVGFLDEAFSAEAAFRILSRDRGTYERLLHEIPPDLDLWDEAADVSEVSPAERLWWDLCDIKGVGPVRAGKLLARKRPRLIPIWDSVVGEVLEPPEGRYWLSMQECLRKDDFHEKVEGLRPRWLSPLVSPLRLLDAAIWIRHSTSEAARRLRERGEVLPGDLAEG